MAKVVKRSDLSKKDYKVDAGLLRIKDGSYNITSDTGDGSVAAFNDIDPLLYWTKPISPKTNAIAHVLFTDGLAYFTFNGSVWVLNFFYPSSSYIPSGPLIYKALLSQSSTSAPTPIISQNTLGVVPVLTREAPGIYKIASVGTFPLSKTHIRIGSSINGSFSEGKTIQTFRGNPDEIMISTQNNVDNVFQDGILSYTSILIEVYP